MTTAARFRKLALSMPEAEERSHFGQPDFRVRNRIFAGLSVDGLRGTLKLPVDVQSEVLALCSAAFSPCPGAWGRSGWTYVELARAVLEQLQPLMQTAWGMTAPRSLVTAHAHAEAPPTKAKRKRAKKRVATPRAASRRGR